MELCDLQYCAFIRKWTKCFIATPGFLEIYKIAYYIDNIDARFNFPNGFITDSQTLFVCIVEKQN